MNYPRRTTNNYPDAMYNKVVGWIEHLLYHNWVTRELADAYVADLAENFEVEGYRQMVFPEGLLYDMQCYDKARGQRATTK